MEEIPWMFHDTSDALRLLRNLAEFDDFVCVHDNLLNRVDVVGSMPFAKASLECERGAAGAIRSARDFL